LHAVICLEKMGRDASSLNVAEKRMQKRFWMMPVLLR
jgi:hypothetical protein